MKRTVTPEETERLFVFTRQHFVFHYDLQEELVDHLASAIEEKWETDPEAGFEQTLPATFKKFGISGFSKFKEAKKKELSRKYNRLFWKHFAEYFTPPKVLITIALTLLLYKIVKTFPYLDLFVILAFITLLGAIIYYYKVIYEKKYKIQLKPGYKFLLVDRLNNNLIIFNIFVQVPIFLFHLVRGWFLRGPISDYTYMLIAFILALVSIGFHCATTYLPLKIREDFMRDYAEFVVL